MTAQQSTTKVDINYPKLPECPFCNNAPRHLEVKAGYYTERVICDHCHFHLEGTATQTAVERWNTRSSEESKYSRYPATLRLRQPPAGWVMVPVEPTKEMIEHAHGIKGGQHGTDI